MEIDEIYQKLQEEIESKNINSLEEMNALVGKLMSHYNNAPREDAEGLSPQQLHQLLGLLFEDNTLITLNSDMPDELARNSPFLKVCMHILNAIPEDKPLKLTTTGALPRWLVLEVYQTGVFTEYDIESGFQKLQKEKDWLLLHLARLICELADLARQGKGKDKGKWILTRKGKKLRNKPTALLVAIFKVYYQRFNWAYVDRYTSDTAGQLGFWFTLFLLHRYGAKRRSVHFYSEKFQKAFPLAVDDFADHIWMKAEESFTNCYSLRSFDRCLLPFGMIEVHEAGKIFFDGYKEEVCITPLFEAFIKLNHDMLAGNGEKTGHPDSAEAEPGSKKEGATSGVASKRSSLSPGSSFSQVFPVEKTPNRNDPCPCGSGRKYKKCCLQ